MKLFKSIAASVLMVGAIAAVPAHATLVTSVITATPDTPVALGATINVLHDLTQSVGYIQGMTFSNASLTIRLTDDSASGGNNETPSLSAGAVLLNGDVGNIGNGTLNSTGTTGTFSYTFLLSSNPVLLDLSADGKLMLFITSVINNAPGRQGNFYFAGSTLTADGTVPEPMSLALLGLGLIGIGAMRRQRAK